MSPNFTLLTPYYFHPLDFRKFRRNVGDGFILMAIQRRSGPFDPSKIFSSRCRPTRHQRHILESSNAVILAGANQLQDNFSPIPGMTPDEHRKSRLRFVPYGVGIGGKEDNSGAKFTSEAIEHLEIIHDRIEYSSWRCPRTVAALKAVLPHRAEQFLMTACPVALDRPLLEAKSFKDADEVVAVTVTDRGNFSEREFPVVKRVAELHPKSRKLLVMHNDFLFWMRMGTDHLPLDPIVGERLRLRRYARSLGYEVVVPRSAEEARKLYLEHVDLHYGSRLHAHLLMLSLNKKSHLVFVDERMTGMAEGLKFPLCPPDNVDVFLEHDFEATRTAAQQADETMRKFENSLMKLVASDLRLAA